MTDTPDDIGLPAGKLEHVFRQARVLLTELGTAKSAASKSTRMGMFLSQNVDRQVRIEVDGRVGRATLRCREGRAHAKYYFFDVIWDDEPSRSPTPQSEPRSDEAMAPRQDGLRKDGTTAISGGQDCPRVPAPPTALTHNDSSIGNSEQW